MHFSVVLLQIFDSAIMFSIFASSKILSNLCTSSNIPCSCVIIMLQKLPFRNLFALTLISSPEAIVISSAWIKTTVFDGNEKFNGEYF